MDVDCRVFTVMENLASLSRGHMMFVFVFQKALYLRLDPRVGRYTFGSKNKDKQRNWIIQSSQQHYPNLLMIS